jgi:hypothetical protein
VEQVCPVAPPLAPLRLRSQASVPAVHGPRKVPYLLVSGSDDGSFKVWGAWRGCVAPSVPLPVHQTCAHSVPTALLHTSSTTGGPSRPLSGASLGRAGTRADTLWRRDPSEESQIAVASADNQVGTARWSGVLAERPRLQVTIWDMSLERDAEEDADIDFEVPPQLLFVHMVRRWPVAVLGGPRGVRA